MLPIFNFLISEIKGNNLPLLKGFIWNQKGRKIFGIIESYSSIMYGFLIFQFRQPLF